MTTLAEYSAMLHAWCLEVESTGVELFKSGVATAKCTGLAISIVEARREKTAAERIRLAAPTAGQLTRM